MLLKLYWFVFVFITFNSFSAVHEEPSLGKLPLPIAATAELRKEDLSTLVRESRTIPLEELRASLPSSLHLRSLTLKNCGLRTPEVRLVSSFLQETGSLTELSLPYNFIEGEGAQALGTALTHNTSLKRLDVSYNRVSSDDLLEAIGTALNTRGTFLDFLSLENNFFARQDQVALERLFSTKIGFLTLQFATTIPLTAVIDALHSQKGKGALAGLQIPYKSGSDLSRIFSHDLEIYRAAREYGTILYTYKPWSSQPHKTEGNLQSFISQNGPDPLSLVASEAIVSVASLEPDVSVGASSSLAVAAPEGSKVENTSPKSPKSPGYRRFNLLGLLKKR